MSTVLLGVAMTPLYVRPCLTRMYTVLLGVAKIPLCISLVTISVVKITDHVIIMSTVLLGVTMWVTL